MDAPIKSPPPTIQFPVSLGRASHDHDDQADNGNGKRKVIDEMDFFADKKESGGAHDDAGEGNRIVHLRGHDSVLDFKVNVCFN